MKKQLALISVMSILTVTIIGGCGSKPQTPSTNSNNPGVIQPSFISSQSTTAAAEETQTSSTNSDSSSAEGSTAERGTVVPHESITIQAIDNNPYLHGITLRASLNTLIARYGDNYTYNPGAKNYTWVFPNDGTVTAIPEDNDLNTIKEISFAPSSYAAWRDGNNDFTKIDTTKSYGYSELCNLVGSAGTVFKLGLNIYMKNTYYVCWYDANGSVLYVQFESSTNKSIYISIL